MTNETTTTAPAWMHLDQAVKWIEKANREGNCEHCINEARTHLDLAQYGVSPRPIPKGA